MRIDQLVYDKFPAAKPEINTAFFDKYGSDKKNINPKLVDPSPEDKEAVINLANKYRKELEVKTIDEIEKIYLPLRKKNEKALDKEIAAIERMIFHGTRMEADFDHWCKMDYWTVDEFIALSFGKNPKKINQSYITKNIYSDIRRDGFIVPLKFPDEYTKRLNLLSRTLIHNLTKSRDEEMDDRLLMPTESLRMSPKDCVDWAQSKEIKIPKQLKSLLPKQEGSVKKLSEQINQKNITIENLLKENEDLKRKAQEREDARVISSLNKILCGLVKKHYPNENSRASTIERMLKNSANIDLNTKTIRTRTTEALKEDKSNKE